MYLHRFYKIFTTSIVTATVFVGEHILSWLMGGIVDINRVKTAYAASGDITYQFMQPIDLPGFGGGDGVMNISGQSLATYVNAIIQIVIGIVIVLAVLMVIAAGIEYMTTGSVTDKSNAKDRIQQAFMGLFLALGAVVILQTINPDLVELNTLEEIQVRGDEINGGGFLQSVTLNPSFKNGDHADDGRYFCYKSDQTTGFSGSWDNVCTESQEDCESALESDQNSKPNTQCRNYLVYGNNGEGYGSNAYCAATGSADKDYDVRIKCYSSSDDPDSNDNVSNPENACQEWVDIRSPATYQACTPVDSFDTSDLGNVHLNQLLEESVLNDSQHPEDQVRNTFAENNIGINKDRCTSVTDTNCTNVGGLSGTVIDKLIVWKNGGLCNGDSCPITVTGGTSWWFHGNQNIDPEKNGGSTCHYPQGFVNAYEDITCDSAIDLRLEESINAFIESNWTKQGDNSGCINDNSGSFTNGNYFLKESDHWHIVVKSSKCS